MFCFSLQKNPPYIYFLFTVFPCISLCKVFKLDFCRPGDRDFDSRHGKCLLHIKTTDGANLSMIVECQRPGRFLGKIGD